MIKQKRELSDIAQNGEPSQVSAITELVKFSDAFFQGAVIGRPIQNKSTIYDCPEFDGMDNYVLQNLDRDIGHLDRRYLLCENGMLVRSGTYSNGTKEFKIMNPASETNTSKFFILTNEGIMVDDYTGQINGPDYKLPSSLDIRSYRNTIQEKLGIDI
tara:strand:- start:4895 stop:5368 length:474 start_codon:yes stop_codon:yes gene_type:complete